MALTPNQTSIVNLVVGMFGAAPGKAYLDAYTAQLEAGASIDAIAEGLAATPFFKSIYPDTLSNEEFAKAWVAKILGGAVTDPAGVTFAETYITGLLNNGASRADAIQAGTKALVDVDNANPIFGKASLILENKMTAAENYSETQSALDIATLTAALAGVTEDPLTIPPVVVIPKEGQTYTLTANAETIVGTDDNDTFSAPVIASGGVAAQSTLNPLDNLDGGAGTDTLIVETDSVISGTFKNIENLTLIGPDRTKGVNGDNALDISDFSGTVKLQQTNDTAVTFSSVTGQTIATDRVADATIVTTNMDANQTSVSLQSMGALGDTAFNIVGTKLTDATLSVDGTKTNKSVVVNSTGNTVKNATIDASGKSSVVVNSTALENVTVKGDGAVTLTTGTAASKMIDATASKGGVTVVTPLNDAAEFKGGAGKDTISVGATTKTQNLGAGDDAVKVAGFALGANGSLDGGEGTDTLELTAANAETASAGTAFEKTVSNFEVLKIDAVGAGLTENIDLANLDDIAIVNSAGTTAGTGKAEVTTVTFNSMLKGQTVTVNGQNYVATTDMTGAQAASAFAVATAIADGVAGNYGESVTGAVVTYTASANGNATDLNAAISNSAGVTLPTAVTTDGVTGSAGTVESSVVVFESLVAGENIQIAGRTVTATAVTETSTVTAGALTTTQTLIINGMTITAGAGTSSAADVAAVLISGVTAGNLTVTGNLNGYVASAGTGTQVVYTSTVLGANVLDVTATGTGAAASIATAIVTVQGHNGNLTATNVANAMNGGTVSGATVVGNHTGFTVTAATGHTLGFTSTTAPSPAGTNVTDLPVTTTGSAPSVTTTQGVNSITAVTESSIVTFNTLLSGQSITVAGRTLTATGGDVTAAQVESSFLSGTSAANAVVTGVYAGFTVAENGGAADGTLIYTSTTATTPVTDISLAGTNAALSTAPAVSIIPGDLTSGGGALNLTNMTTGGTLELTGAINGASSVVVKDAATNAADIFNIKLNGAANINNTAALTIANVETINVEATDSDSSNDPTSASALNLNATAATTVNVTGNHGVNFAGHNLTSLTALDASGVTGTGAAGSVTFTSLVTTKDVNLKGGAGNDTLAGASTSTKVTTIDGGAGNDTITGGAGKDVLLGGDGNDTITGGAKADALTGGAGNDNFVLSQVTDSVLAARDVIADFSANTFGNGAAGAAGTGANGTAANWTGDVLTIDVAVAQVGVGVVVGVQANAADAQTFIQNTFANGTANQVGVALDSSTGLLYIDSDSNGTIDSVVELTGVTTIDAAAIALI